MARRRLALTNQQFPDWRHLKDKLSNHHCWADLPALERATGTLLDGLRAEFHRPGRGIRLVHTLCTVG